jgi:hypothetical protein
MAVVRRNGDSRIKFPGRLGTFAADAPVNRIITCLGVGEVANNSGLNIDHPETRRFQIRTDATQVFLCSDVEIANQHESA